MKKLIFILLVMTSIAGRADAIRTEEIAGGFQNPTDFHFFPGNPYRLIVLGKKGAVVSHDLKTKKQTVLLTLTGIAANSELGLLGLTFHPDFLKNKKLYLNYTPIINGKNFTRVSEWIFSEIGISGERVLFEIQQPFSNHNGGQLQFGPDGFLYVGMGDGGSAGDPQKHGQNLSSLFGKMLRIDVNRQEAGLPYGIPADNPFVKTAGARAEIFAYGLRNPWRFSFDPKGRLVAADVGQYLWEEVGFVPKGSNCGWNKMEGRHCFPANTTCDPKEFQLPFYEYDRDKGQSVTGGVVYTGSAIPELKGKYVFGDFASGFVAALDLPVQNGVVNEAKVLSVVPSGFNIVSFQRDPQGEVYFADHSNGKIYKLVP